MNGTAARRSASAPPVEWASRLEAGLEACDQADTLPSTGRRARRSTIGLLRQTAYGFIDVAVVCCSGILIFWLRFGRANPSGGVIFFPGQLLHQFWGSGYSRFLLLYAALIVLACMSQDLYRTAREKSALAESLSVVRAVGVATVLLVLAIFASGNKEISRLVVACSGALNLATLAGWRYAKRQMALRRVQRGVGVSRVLVVGAGKLGQTFASWLEENRQLGYAMCGFLDPHPNGDRRVLGSIRDLHAVALTHFVDELFVTLPAERELVKEIFLEARRLRLNLHVVPDLYDGLGWRAPLHRIGGFPVIELRWQPIPAFGLAVKRAMDIIAASLGLIVTAPILALAALWVRLDSRGPVFYAAERVGRKGRRFRCYKLRTMVVDADARKEALRNANERNGPFFKMKNDPRITRCGRWLRKYSLDELPQLWNVLRGDMSLVGPRPHPVDDFERYTLENLRRLDVKPGITGLWQVRARRDPSFDTNMALDLEYIENWSLRMDIGILLKTIPAVVRAEGN
jgi:exopolysaccharide biosynthesis polyprenyl glycosylphosphotransferase